MDDSLYQLKQELRGICQSKAEEFHFLGYEQVSAEEIWECVASTYKKEIPSIHQIVNDIFSLKVTKFMNWLTIRVYKGDF